MAYEPCTVICVFCVHRLPASALEFFLDLQRRKAGNEPRRYAIPVLPSLNGSTLNRSESL
jgi:hypothetical protein